MVILTKRASEEVVIDQSVRVIVLETGADHVKFGILDTGHSCGETFSDSDRLIGMRVKIIAPYGEEIEIDC